MAKEMTKNERFMLTMMTTDILDVVMETTFAMTEEAVGHMDRCMRVRFALKQYCHCEPGDDQLFPKIETLAIFANIMPLWFLKMATLVDKVDCLPGCSIDKDGRVHPANYPTDWLDSEIYGSEKIEYNSMAQLVHPRGRYMERFRHLVWTRTCSGKYLGKVEMSCVEECMKKYLLDMGWKEEWIDKCLRAKCTEHFDWEVVDGGRRDHLRDDW